MIRRATAADHDWIRVTAADVYVELGDYGTIIGSWLDHAGVAVFVDELAPAGELRGFTLVGLYAPEDAPPGVSTADLLAIAVAPPHQRQGIGRALLRHAIDVARASGGDRCVRELRLTVADGNARAQALFAQHGFEVIDAHYGSYDGGQRALRMALAL